MENSGPFPVPRRIAARTRSLGSKAPAAMDAGVRPIADLNLKFEIDLGAPVSRLALGHRFEKDRVRIGARLN